jgi:glycosyltransferase involved in cell wall biosynthesis
MIVAHVGPAIGRQGGPAGYLAQLQAALDNYGTGHHDIRLPAAAAHAAPAPAATVAVSRPVSAARRLHRKLFGTPRFYRPSNAQLQTAGGLDGAIAAAWEDAQRGSATALANAATARPDVLFAHDIPGAEAALEVRKPGQQVWIFLHSPMPIALYVVWCWGVPERSWEEVAQFPDVQTWMSRELRVLDAVDRIVLPCPEAAGELARADRRFESALRRATFILTGASGPLRHGASKTREEMRAHWNLPLHEPLGLFLGNAQPYRGLDLLTAALATLPEGTPATGAVVVAGVAADRLPKHARIRALGRVEEIADLLATVDFVINVNRFSLLDLSLIEAIEAAKPLLLHQTGGNVAFARLGVGCVLIDQLSAAAIGRGLHAMFSQSTASREQLGRDSRTCYERHFTLRHLRDRHIALYDEVSLSVSA